MTLAEVDLAVADEEECNNISIYKNIEGVS